MKRYNCAPPSAGHKAKQKTTRGFARGFFIFLIFKDFLNLIFLGVIFIKQNLLIIKFFFVKLEKLLI